MFVWKETKCCRNAERNVGQGKAEGQMHNNHVRISTQCPFQSAQWKWPSSDWPGVSRAPCAWMPCDHGKTCVVAVNSAETVVMFIPRFFVSFTPAFLNCCGLDLMAFMGFIHKCVHVACLCVCSVWVDGIILNILGPHLWPAGLSICSSYSTRGLLLGKSTF